MPPTGDASRIWPRSTQRVRHLATSTGRIPPSSRIRTITRPELPNGPAGPGRRRNLGRHSGVQGVPVGRSEFSAVRAERQLPADLHTECRTDSSRGLTPNELQDLQAAHAWLALLLCG